MALLVYMDTVVTPIPNEKIDFPALRRRLPQAEPASDGWVWCKWPDGKLWKHWRGQLS